MVLDKPKSTEQIKAERKAFRDEFIVEIPVGTRVENLVLDNNDHGKPRTATTAPGRIYEDEFCDTVNVEKIDGKDDLGFGIWTAAFVRKVEEKAS